MSELFTIIFPIVAIVLSLAATITFFCIIVPKKRKEKMKNPFLIFLHDLFNFKSLLIEKILKFLYILYTLFCLIYGFFMLFYFEETYYYGVYSSGHYEKEWRGYIGLLIMILGPIIARIAFELIMMAVLLVQNVIEINHKLDAKKSDDSNNKQQPTTEEVSNTNQENNYNQENAYYQENNYNQGNGYYQANNNQGNGYYQVNNNQGNGYYQANNNQGNGYNQ